MSPWKHAILFAVLTAIPAMGAAAAKPAEERPAQRLESALKHVLTNDAKLPAFRIEATGRLATDLHALTIYGRGIGIWNRERQFELTPDQVKKVIRIVLDHHLCTLPEEIGGEEEEGEAAEHTSRPPRRRDHALDGANPQILLRTVTITFGNLSRTVIQEAEIPEAVPLEKGLAELAALCRKPAAGGLTVHSLKEGLRLVAKGKVAPEALHLLVNAPQLRSFKDNSGQGWILRIEHGRVVAQSHDLKRGYRTLADRPMKPAEIRALARKLLAAHVETLPRQVNVPGYLDLRIDVLSNVGQVMARTYAGTPEPKAVTTFTAVRELLHSTWERVARPGRRSPAS